MRFVKALSTGITTWSLRCMTSRAEHTHIHRHGVEYLLRDHSDADERNRWFASRNVQYVAEHTCIYRTHTHIKTSIHTNTDAHKYTTHTHIHIQARAHKHTHTHARIQWQNIMRLHMTDASKCPWLFQFGYQTLNTRISAYGSIIGYVKGVTTNKIDRITLPGKTKSVSCAEIYFIVVTLYIRGVNLV